LKMEEIDTKLLERLQALCDNEKELSERKREKLASKIDLKFISTLLSVYTAKQTIEDVQIFNLLQVIETKLGVSLKIAAPLVFGPKSVPYYMDLIKYGRTLRGIISPNEFFSYLNKEILLKTSYIMCRGPREELYDPRFLLRLFLSMVQRGTELKCQAFIGNGALQFVLSALSLRDSELRSMAYVILQRFLSLTNELSDEDFPEQALISYFLRLIKYGVQKPNQRLTSPVSRFLADSIVVLMHPTFTMFKPLMASLTQKPSINLNFLPEFNKFFYSTSLSNHQTERKWILNICSTSIHDPGDYGMLEKSSVIGSCLAAFTSNLCNDVMRTRILSILNSCLRHGSCARDLFLTHNLSTWLACVAHSPGLKQVDLDKIKKLHETLSGHIKEWFAKSPDPLIKAQLKMNSKRIKSATVDEEMKVVTENGDAPVIEEPMET